MSEQDGDVWNGIVFQREGKHYVTKFKSRHQEGDKMIVEIEAVPTEYPHAAKYIRDLDKLDKTTQETYEFEAHICDAVLDAVGRQECPHCSGLVFKIGDAKVDFSFPFVSGYRIQLDGVSFRAPPWEEEFVKCLICGATFPTKK